MTTAAFEAIADAMVDELRAVLPSTIKVRQNASSPIPLNITHAVDVMQGTSLPDKTNLAVTDWQTHIAVRFMGRMGSSDRTALHAAASVRNAAMPLLRMTNASLVTRLAGLAVGAINQGSADGDLRPDIDTGDEQVAVIETTLIVRHRTGGETYTPWN